MKIEQIIKTNPPRFAIISHPFSDEIDIYVDGDVVEIYVTEEPITFSFTEEDLQFFLDTIAMMKIQE